MAVNFTDDTFQSDVLDADGLVMVDFWAEWCGPCRMLTPLIEELGEEMKDKVKVGKLNVDENPQIAAKFQIMSIPTVILFKDGEPVEGYIGVQPKDVYVDGINKHS
jgi:thioredoxin 1